MTMCVNGGATQPKNPDLDLSKCLYEGSATENMSEIRQKYFDLEAPLGFSGLHLRKFIALNRDAACNSTVCTLCIPQKQLIAELNGK